MLRKGTIGLYSEAKSRAEVQAKSTKEVRIFILGEEVIYVASCAVVFLKLESEVLEHRGVEVVERGDLLVVLLLHIDVAFVFEAATSDHNGEVAVRVARGITERTSKKHHGVIK